MADFLNWRLRRAPHLRIRLVLLHELLVEHIYALEELRILRLNLLFVLIDFLELLREIGQDVQEFFHHDDAKHQTFAIAAEGFNDEFEGDALQYVVKEAVFDYSSEKLRDLGQVHMRVLVQEPVFVEETVKDTGINFLLFDHLRLLELLQGGDQLSDPVVNLVRLCAENGLKVLVSGLVNFLC